MSTPPTTTVTLPWVGSLRLSRPQLVFVGGVAALSVLGLLEWPVALVLGAGHVLAADRSDPAVRQAGEALETV
ncbi:hypothetical protein [Actinomycetospora sp. NBRC 106378]|uniref:hypothetical protein n=1 Tax=Actinomycetospora sp. NBRC 106378 TaxID=3032208 RepID=UPI0024A47891|nr:hypothetical protein [Actinomycetospora sp. NBRC 106378]GLZ55288.1 hypothetical protein Acsp07_49050 [Actinomycetospora sp. NBRC 106378]